MDKFQDAYRQAAERLPRFHMDASCVQDELHHRRLMQRKRKQMLLRSCSAAAVLCLLCGTGVAAKNYRDSVLRMRENGFTLTDQENAVRAMAEDMDGMAADSGQDPGEGAAMAMMDTGEAVGEGWEDGDAWKRRAESQDVLPEQIESVEMEPVEYDSVETFRAAESVAVVIPGMELFPVSFEEESVLVMEGGRHILIRYMGEEGYFCLSQQDNRDLAGYSRGVSYTGEVSNERMFTNSQGLNFTVFDTVEEGKQDAVHAVISVNGRDLIMDFKGFEEQVIEKILGTMDLSIYFEETP